MNLFYILHKNINKLIFFIQNSNKFINKFKNILTVKIKQKIKIYFIQLLCS